MSVVYLAVQVKKQTQEAKLAATRELSEQAQQFLHFLTSDFEFTEIYGKAVQNYDDLPETQRLWASLVFQRMCRLMEQQVLHIDHGNTDPVFLGAMKQVYSELMTFPGFQQWWLRSSNLFSAGFVGYVEDNLAAAKAHGYQSSFNKDSKNAT